ncbi:MAG: hypothetical protein KIT54_10425 [Phycisphaeraceae bacterium]|nr:hypothetical protein [Phycisphaeraceae bacterium]
MDERQGQIKDRAGLEDSRINEEFRDFLLKWGPRVLIVVALVALAFSGRRFINQKATERKDEAFVQLALATSTPTTSPDTLLSLADRYGDVAAVAHVARLAAAEAYLEAVRTGVVIGAQPGPMGDYPAEELISEDLRDSYLAQAHRIYTQVSTSNAAPIHRIQALLGLAAVAESKGDLASARDAYTRAAELDRTRGFGLLARVAQERIDTLDMLAEPVVLHLAQDLPRPPQPGGQPEVEVDPFDFGGFGFDFTMPTEPEAPLDPDTPVQDPGR